MRTDGFKETDPVFYGGRTVKYWNSAIPKDTACFWLHWHERMEILNVLKGSLIVRVGDACFTASAGETVIVSPGKPHSAQTGPDGAVYDVFMFDLALLQNENQQIRKQIESLLQMKKRFIEIVRDTIISDCCNRIALLHQNWQHGNELSEVGYVYQLIGHLYRAHLLENPLPASSNERFSEITDYIAEHFTENLTTAEISEKFNYAEAYFCRKFKAVTGLTPMNYIRILRLEESCKLLKNGTSIREVASLCGFRDQNYYARSFKEHYHMSPTEYIRSQSGTAT